MIFRIDSFGEKKRIKKFGKTKEKKIYFASMFSPSRDFNFKLQISMHYSKKSFVTTIINFIISVSAVV